ncbi:MAG TPA: GNAT family N-acetyltransferase [Candidatus Saccharimonadales bacterium]|nr:GNAT family N-acetyltransferase [Candidatus Saccharimonadales bacterium]
MSDMEKSKVAQTAQPEIVPYDDSMYDELKALDIEVEAQVLQDAGVPEADALHSARALYDDRYRATLRRLTQEPRSYTRVARVGGHIVGWCFASKANRDNLGQDGLDEEGFAPANTIGSIGVSQGFRHQGIATALTKRFLDEVADPTAPTTIYAKASAVAFWRRMGFDVVDTDHEPERVGDVEVPMLNMKREAEES